MLFMQLKYGNLVNLFSLSKMGSHRGTSPLQNTQSLNYNKDLLLKLFGNRKCIFKNVTDNSEFNFLILIATAVQVFLYGL